ncbi:MAG: glycosyltransferase [bacterium]
MHSRYSNKPSNWALRKINCPESYSSPKFIYETAQKRGMDFVTITDHNSIEGACEIAHLPGTFISSELTVFFPEKGGCKIHLVVLDVNEESFKECRNLSSNIYELALYLRKMQIVHFIAHPLYEINGKLSVDIVEKLLILFNTFEVKNGARTRKTNDFFKAILLSLTPEKVTELVDKHDLSPYGPRPWKKSIVGGSDDHGGLFIGRSYTVCPRGNSVQEFVSSIEAGESWVEGEDGDPLTLAHSVYGIGYRFITEKVMAKNGQSLPFVKMMLNRLFDFQPRKTSPYERVKLFIKMKIPESLQSKDNTLSFEQLLDKEARRLLTNANLLEKMDSSSVNRRIFTCTSHLINRMIYIYTEKLSGLSSSIELTSIFDSLSTLGMVHLLASPYYLAFHHQYRSKKLMSDLKETFNLSPGIFDKQKVALFTDTLEDINGVAITINRILQTAKRRGIDLVIITSSHRETGYRGGIMNFQSVGDFALPEYSQLKMHFPPILDMLDYIEREGFTRIHVSTPGTVGLMALFIAKLMDMSITGTYHTDIPEYIRDLTGDDGLESAAWNYMIWFYNQMNEVTVPSAATRRQLIERGLPEWKTKPLPRWVDTEVFTPSKREPHFWRKYGLNGDIKFLYVGRISKEKNLKLLAEVFKGIIESNLSADLVLVGDGPYRSELEKELEEYPVLFTGYLTGDELCKAYASSDVFIFPSTTDTFGNVVLEAQSSGLPVIVSNEGGPKEIMKEHETGLVFQADDKRALYAAMKSFIDNRERISRMGSKAREFTVKNSIDDTKAYQTILYSSCDSSSCDSTSCDSGPIRLTPQWRAA